MNSKYINANAPPGNNANAPPGRMKVSSVKLSAFGINRQNNADGLLELKT